jgi:two-component system sensor histidine kinase KdpD
MSEAALGVARWVLEHQEPAGTGTDTLPGADALYLPMAASGRAVGVLRVVVRDPRLARDPIERQLLEAVAGQAGLALERAELVRRSERTRLEIEAERLRTNLLSSLSHDLRTPLGAIEGAASTLLDSGEAIAPAGRRELLLAVLEESRRMNRLIGNLLEMVKVESGLVEVRKEWQPLEEVVGIALLRLDAQLAGRGVQTHLPADLPLVAIDGLLIEQVLINLLDNAAKYTPAGSPIDIGAEAEDGTVIVEVADRGSGIPREEEERVFQKFTRLADQAGPRGAGLGLAICRGIVTAHGGRIWVEPRPGGGARFRFSLPMEGPPPSLPPFGDDEPAPDEAGGTA